MDDILIGGGQVIGGTGAPALDGVSHRNVIG
jgi:hypothetical protein